MTRRHIYDATSIPISFYGIVLGIIGLGNDWLYSSILWGVPSIVGNTLVVFSIIIWTALTIIKTIHLFFFAKDLIDDARHPVICNFVSLFPATTVLISISLEPYFRTMAIVIFTFGATLQIIYSAWQGAGLWRGEYPQEAMTPGIYLPTVANNFICTMGCGALGYNNLGELFFGAGLFSWLSLEPAVLNRLRSCHALPKEMRPLLGVQIAPALVACSAYMSINKWHGDFFSNCLFGYGLLQLIFVIRLSPWYLKQSFTTSFWCFSFGLAALSSSALHLWSANCFNLFYFLSPFLFLFTNVVFFLLIIQTIRLWIKNVLIPPHQ